MLDASYKDGLALTLYRKYRGKYQGLHFATFIQDEYLSGAINFN